MAGIAVCLPKIARMNFHDAKFMGVGCLQADPHWRMQAHAHTFHEFIVIFRGVEHVAIRDRELTAPTGTALFYPAGVAHAEWADARRAFTSYFISFEWPAYPADIPLEARDFNGRIRQLITWLYAERLSHSPRSQLERDALLQALLLEYLKACDHKAADHQLISTIQTFIHERIEQRLTLADLARCAGMSKYHFLRTYKALAGRTPMEEVRAIRLERARELILSTSLPLKDIAPQSGLGNEYALSRLFRRRFGVAPGEMRKSKSDR